MKTNNDIIRNFFVRELTTESPLFFLSIDIPPQPRIFVRYRNTNLEFFL
jgi:hypothetical protein